MICKTLELKTNNFGFTSTLSTYILNNSYDLENRKKPCVIICPGGGYEFCSDREAEPVALNFNAKGIHAAVLNYSVVPSRFPMALSELAIAVATVREHAEEWRVDENRIFVCGFSAGGHLAASLGIFWHEDFLSEETLLSKELVKPNGLILSYPVICSTEYAHSGSFKNLLGDKYDTQFLEELSLDKKVSVNTPPTFLWHTNEDVTVDSYNSIAFAMALKKHSIPLELHIYENGWHGLSTVQNYINEGKLNPDIELASNWINLASRWIERH